VNVAFPCRASAANAQTKATKKVAGTLKLELAQYNALAAFAQFASDLDKASQNQLARGSRLVELLKQAQFRPPADGRAGRLDLRRRQGKVDDVEVSKVRRFELELHAFMHRAHADLLKEIGDKKVLDDPMSARLSAAIDDFQAHLQVAMPSLRELRSASKARELQQSQGHDGAAARLRRSQDACLRAPFANRSPSVIQDMAT